MKASLKYLILLALPVVALTRPSAKLNSTEEKNERPAENENSAAREAFRRQLLQDENGQIPPNALLDALKHKEAMQFLPEAWGQSLDGNDQKTSGWVPIGPAKIGGRVRSIIIHPTNPATMWLGAVGGGVWKTTDGGESWSTNTDFLAGLAVNCMAIDPANPNILYAGTGEGFLNGDAIPGHGIFKTIDGGSTWSNPTQPLSENDDFVWVNRLAIAPTNSQLILAATRSGKILRNTTGGEGNWSTQLFLAGAIVSDVRFQPTAPGAGLKVPGLKCVAGTIGNGAFYSNDSGQTWTAATGLPAPAGRVELAYSRSNPEIVYASVDVTDPGPPSTRGKLYKSTNGGSSFTLQGAPSGGTEVNGYNNSLWVDPTNPNTVVVGSYTLWRTTQGGAGGWVNVATGIHFDHHVIVEQPGYNGTTNAILYGGNDGGIYKTTNALDPIVTWTNWNHNLVITQFYGGAGHAATGVIIGGTQDNGTLRSPNPPSPDWITSFYLGGDGGRCAVDQTSNPYFYGEAIFLQMIRSTDGGFNTTGIWEGIPHAECSPVPCANFVAPFVIDPNNENRIYAGGISLWRSNNVRAEPATTVAWNEVKTRVPANCSIPQCVPIYSIVVDQANSNVVWVGYNDGSVYRTTNATGRIPVWTKLDSGLPQARFCTSLAIGPVPKLGGPRVVGPTVYATFSGFHTDNVWKTITNGISWMPIHNNLPPTSVLCLVIHPANPNWLYVGTEIGVFASVDGGTTWSPDPPGANGPANVHVEQLFWMGNTLVAVTHGRGMFTIAQ